MQPPSGGFLIGGNAVEEYEEVPLYVCDPGKAVTCKKTNCNARLGTDAFCFCTWNPFYAKTDDQGQPILHAMIKKPRRINQ